MVKITTRIVAAPLFPLAALMLLGLAGSFELGRRLNAEPVSVSSSDSNGAQPAQGTPRTPPENRMLGTLTAAAEGLSLLFCGTLCGLGFRRRNRANRASLPTPQAETFLQKKRRAAENQAEDRTGELSDEEKDLPRALELNRAYQHVLEMLVSPGELTTEDILGHLTNTLAAQGETWSCALHLADPGSKNLRLVASSDVDENLRNYLNRVGLDLQHAPERRAFGSSETCIADPSGDVRTWSEVLVTAGIRGVWSVPFRVNDSSLVTGTLSVYSTQPGEPTARELEMAETASRLAALVVEHRRIHSELVQNAYQDALTGLPNRRAGEQALASAIQEAGQRGESVAVLWIDINRFKRINDQYGHVAGDMVLRTAAERLRLHATPAGTVARMGEDEFLVLLRGPVDSIDPVETSRRISAALARPIHAGSALISLSAGIGVCLYPQDGATAESLERNAEFAMYRAKATASPWCAFTLAMSEEASEALEIEEALGVAIEQNYLRLAYQPLYSQGGELTGFEALLRFQHPRLGIIPPARFIPIAEETRLIVPIGNWVLHEACRQLQAWHQAGHRRVYMAVNISALQFARDDFADTVARIFTECNLAPEHLILELTESVVMEDYDTVVRQMTLLKQCGVRIAMDDFGTGYSSLSYIHRIPIDVLKIDRSFIERLADPEGTRPIVEAVIAMARHLGLQVVAEGVETTEQQDILQQAGCHSYQGFLFARPLPAEEAEGCLAASRSTPFANPRMRPTAAKLAVA